MKTYDEILSSMQEKFIQLSGLEPDDASDIGIRIKVLAGEIFSLLSNIDWLKRQVFPQTAVGEYLDLHAQQRGLERKEAAKSTGTLTFSRTSPLLYDVSIPKGTVCSTSGTDPIRVVTTNKVILYAGEYSVSAPAEAEQGGPSGNLAIDSVSIMVTPPPGISSVTNSTPFTGGSNAETDDELRERLLYSYKNIPNGTNTAFYKNEVSKYSGVNSVSVVPKARGAGTVDIYVDTDSQDANTLITKIQNDLNSLREINVDVLVQAPSAIQCSVYFNLWVDPAYDFNAVKLACVATVTSYINSLGIGKKFYLSGVGNAIFNVPGVVNYSFITSLCSDKTITNTQIATVGTIGVTEGS